MEIVAEAAVSFQGQATRATLRLTRRPNTQLNLLLADLNYQRIAAHLRELPRYSAYKDALLGVASGCFENKAKPFLPEPYGQKAEAILASGRKEMIAIVDANIKDKYRRFFAAHNLAAPKEVASEFNGFDGYYAQYAGDLRYLVQRAGAEMLDWSVALTPRASTFSTGRRGLLDVGIAFLGEAETDSDFDSFFKSGGKIATPPQQPFLDCEKLAPKPRPHRSSRQRSGQTFGPGFFIKPRAGIRSSTRGAPVRVLPFQGGKRRADYPFR